MAILSDSVEEHLLPNKDPAPYLKRITATRLLAKWVLDMAMGLIFALWVAIIFLFPAKSVSSFIEKWLVTTSKTIFGITGLADQCSLHLLMIIEYLNLSQVPGCSFRIELAA